MRNLAFPQIWSVCGIERGPYNQGPNFLAYRFKSDRPNNEIATPPCFTIAPKRTLKNWRLCDWMANALLQFAAYLHILWVFLSFGIPKLNPVFGRIYDSSPGMVILYIEIFSQ